MGRITAFLQRVFKFTYYDNSALERLEGQATFKFRAFWSVRAGKVLIREFLQLLVKFLIIIYLTMFPVATNISL
jgi:hypothetical protein